MTNRRNFIRISGLTAIAGVTGIETVFPFGQRKSVKYSGKGLVLRFVAYPLQLKHTFTAS
jgi:hypothetical protein